MELLVGIQILAPSGREVFSYQDPEQTNTIYSNVELLQFFQAGKLENSETTAFVGIASNAGTDYIYILYFPMDVSKVTMYVNRERFAGGKTIILPILSALLLLVLISGVLYRIFTTKAIKRLTTSIQEISVRGYLLIQDHEEKNIVRFLKELAIDILNTPEYENRTIHFESTEEPVLFSFDQTLFTRAFRNLIINAFVHGDEHTEVTLSLLHDNSSLKICVADNGKGMESETIEHLFDRYYRGTNTDQ